jgi:hypothetical protein
MEQIKLNNDVTKIQRILGKNLYSSKYAWMTEICQNAVDSMRKAGKSDKYILFDISAVKDSNHYIVSIRDFGVSFDNNDDIISYLCTVLKSSKGDIKTSDDNQEIGQFGIGKIAISALVDKWNYTIYKNGKKCELLLTDNINKGIEYQLNDWTDTKEEDGVLFWFSTENIIDNSSVEEILNNIPKLAYFENIYYSFDSQLENRFEYKRIGNHLLGNINDYKIYKNDLFIKSTLDSSIRMGIVVDQYKYIVNTEEINAISNINIRLNLNNVEPNPTRETVIEDDAYITLINDKLAKIKTYLLDKWISSIPVHMSLYEIYRFSNYHVNLFTTDKYSISLNSIIDPDDFDIYDYIQNKHKSLNKNIYNNIRLNDTPYRLSKVITGNKMYNGRNSKVSLLDNEYIYVIYDGVINRNIKNFIQTKYLYKDDSIKKLAFITKTELDNKYKQYDLENIFDIIEDELFIKWSDIEKAYDVYKEDLKTQNKTIPVVKTTRTKLADGIISITRCRNYSKPINNTIQFNINDLYKYKSKIIYTNENLNMLYQYERLFHRFNIHNYIFVYVNKTTYKTMNDLKTEKLINIDDIKLFNNPSFKKVVTKSIIRHHLKKYLFSYKYKDFIRTYISEDIMNKYDELVNYTSFSDNIDDLECYRDIIALASQIKVVDQDYLNKCNEILPILSKLKKIELLFISSVDYYNDPKYHTKKEVLDMTIEICRYLGIKYKWDKSIYKFMEEPIKEDLIAEIIE